MATRCWLPACTHLSYLCITLIRLQEVDEEAQARFMWLMFDNDHKIDAEEFLPAITLLLSTVRLASPPFTRCSD